MRWRGRQRSENVEDRRGMGPKTVVGGGLLVLVLTIIGSIMGIDVRPLIGLAGQGQNQPQQQQRQGAGPIDDEARNFIEVVLFDTEQVWTDQFRQHVQGGTYKKPKLIIFEGQVNSGCGRASAAMGPFYCPADEQIYIDPSFFEQLRRRHSAPGDFAHAYVIAHEVAHHVQKLIGFSDKVNQVRRRGNEAESNRASVRLELQADFLAGVWAHHAHKNFNILEDGDLEEAINAAKQIGDDTLQKQAQGYANPQHYTHGTSQQRVHWFREGLISGDINRCEELFTMNYADL